MQRETKEIKVGAHTIVVNTYLTGKEARDLRGALISGAKFGQGEGDKPALESFDPKAMLEIESLALKLLVVSFDGTTEGAAEAVENLRMEEYNEVIESINAITKDALNPSGFLAN